MTWIRKTLLKLIFIEKKNSKTKVSQQEWWQNTSYFYIGPKRQCHGNYSKI